MASELMVKETGGLDIIKDKESVFQEGGVFSLCQLLQRGAETKNAKFFRFGTEQPLANLSRAISDGA